MLPAPGHGDMRWQMIGTALALQVHIKVRIFAELSAQRRVDMKARYRRPKLAAYDNGVLNRAHQCAIQDAFFIA